MDPAQPSPKPYRLKPAGSAPATPRQKDFLRSLSIPIPPDLSKSEASRLLSEARARGWQGDSPTEAQMVCLQRLGVPHPDRLTKGEAAALIQRAADRHRRQKAERVRRRESLTFGLAVLGGVVGAALGSAFGWPGVFVGLPVGAAIGYQRGAAAARRLRRG